ncbi:sialate O-acetylesterase [Catalinimonas sp. 4WD22]|uniref:sialate O-acetylesterase n=1 Tax=Catalinimonas locisalis TaxID=3133978 RepID=UPI003100FF51
MKIIFILALSCTLFISLPTALAQEGKHLFILSGQSNMGGLRPQESFTPAVEAEFGSDHVIVVKSAYGGQPIRRWYKDWTPPQGDEPKAQPDLYDSLINKVNATIEEEEIATVTFIWMQGERDAKEELAEVYEESLMGLYQQLRDDLGRTDINFVIGRLSDHDLESQNYPQWPVMREIQVKVAESNPRFGWINTDDLNDGVNRKGDKIKDDLHMSAEGYVEMGNRFADKSIELIRKQEREME